MCMSKNNASRDERGAEAHLNIVDGRQQHADGHDAQRHLDGRRERCTVERALYERNVRRGQDLHHLVEADGVEGER